MQTRCRTILPATLAYSVLLILLGITLDGPAAVLSGLYRIVSMQDLLITDYVQIAGVGAALVNSGLVTLVSILLIRLSGTTLAPISGHFGWPFGILAGFIHASLVLQTGDPVAGLNLYNNGFSGGLITIVLYPVLTAILRRRKPVLREADYYDLFEENAPIDASVWLAQSAGAAETSDSAAPKAPMSDDTDSFDIRSRTRD